MKLNKLLVLIILAIGINSACEDKKKNKIETLPTTTNTNTNNLSDSLIIPKINLANKKYILYTIDTAKSKIHWNASQHFGYLKYKNGNLAFDNKTLAEAVFTVDMNSIKDVDIDYKLMQGTLVNVLKSIEFFNIAIYPNAYFELKHADKIDKDNYKFSSNFIILNKNIPIDFIGNLKIQKDSLFLNTKSIILNRTDWGMYYLSRNNPNPKEGEDGFIVSDTITIDTHIIAYKQQ